MVAPPLIAPVKLFALLRHLGIDQQRVARELGVSHTTVSFWVRGRLPLPEKHARVIHQLVRDTLAASQEAGLQAAEAASARLQAARSPAERETAGDDLQQRLEAFKATLATQSRLVEEWQIEERVMSGQLHQELYEQCRGLGLIGQRQPRPLTPAQRAEMGAAVATIDRCLRQLARLDDTPATLVRDLEEQQAAVDQRLRVVG